MDQGASVDIVTLACERTPVNRTKMQYTYLTRHELSLILGLYGRKVAAGIWRDYAIDNMEHLAIFSIFRRASEAPQFQIIKDPSLRRRQGMWRISGANGQIFKRGHDLKQLLSYFREEKTDQAVLAFT